jgi:hypothetical protein
MQFLLRLFRAWNRFWFSPGDPTTLGLVRLFCGFTVLYIHLAYTYDLQAFIGPHAWLDLQMLNEFRAERPIAAPVSSWDESTPQAPESADDEQFLKKWGMTRKQAAFFGHRTWSVWFHVTSPTGIWTVHSSILVIMFLFAIGFCTRITGVLTWLGVLSYIHRAPTALFGLDTIMIILVLYLMIGPSGAAFSVDRLIHRYWATYRALTEHRPVPESLGPTPQVSANLALRLIQVHLCIFYLVSGVSKLLGPAWWSGTATWLTIANYEFAPMNLRIYKDFLLFLSNHFMLWQVFMTGGTYFTLAFEISFLFLIWNRRLRPVMIIGAVLLHAGIASFMGLMTFSMMMLIGVLSFVPPETVREFFWRLGRGPSAVSFARLEA